MNKTLVASALVAALVHGSIFLTGSGHGPEAESQTQVEVALTEEAPPPPPPPPPPVVSEDAEESDSNEPLLPEDFLAAGLNEPPPTSIATDAITQVVRPEAVRPPRPENVSVLIPGRDQKAAGTSAKEAIIFDVSELDREPSILYDVAPAYPQELKSAHVKGPVDTIITVDVRGRVTDVQILRSPHPALGMEVEKAIRRWRFEPALKDGQIVPFRAKRTILY